jgi:signal peptidase II
MQPVRPANPSLPIVAWHRYVVFAAIAISGCAIDLATKSWMFALPELHGGAVYWIWPEYVGFQTSLNEGALFGMGQGMVWLFAVASVVAAVAIPMWLFYFRAAHELFLTVALGCIMAGVLGNLYDRLGLPGLIRHLPPDRAGERVYAVRDWILLQYSDQLRWPNFNIADSLLVTGACLLVWEMWSHSSQAHSTVTTGGNPEAKGAETAHAK